MTVRSVAVSKPSPHEKNLFLLTYNLLNDTYFFLIEFCIGYIKGSIWISPKANNQCRCHSPRSFNCLLCDVGDLGWTYRFPLKKSSNSVSRQPGKLRPLTSVMTASMRRYRQQTGESFTSRNAVTKHLDGSAKWSQHQLLGVHAPCDRLPCPVPPPRPSAASAHAGGQSSSRSLSRSMKGSSM